MNKYARNAVIIGVSIPLLFLIISLVTGNWKFLLFSLPPAFASTMTAVNSARKQTRA